MWCMYQLHFKLIAHSDFKNKKKPLAFQHKFQNLQTPQKNEKLHKKYLS